MKVYQNIEAYRKRLEQRKEMSPSDIDTLCNELKRIIDDLVPLRNNREATSRYYDANLQHDWKEAEFHRLNAEKALNGMPVDSDEYVPGEKECCISEDILHNALITILQDDRYSFGHLYWMLCSRYNREAHFAFYNDIVVPDSTIEYAINFDVEQLREDFGKSGDIIDRLDFLESRLADSVAFNGNNSDKTFLYLKDRYEKVVNDMMNILNHRLESVGYPTRDKSGQVKEVPSIVDSIGLEEEGYEEYVTYYDFVKCPVDVSEYPFSVHLGTYRITRTTRGLEDESPIFVDIVSNIYRQIAYADNDAAQDIFKDTRDLLTALFKIYVQRICELHKGDFDAILYPLRWWAQNTVECFRKAFNTKVLPEYHYGVNEALRANCWEHCILFMESMSEFSLLLPIVFLNDVKGNPYKDVHAIIPFNYYGKDYATVTESANKKTFKNNSERIATEYKENCRYFKDYLRGRLKNLDGKSVNDEGATSVRHAIIEDMVSMANDYLENLQSSNINKASHLKYAFDLWLWYVKWINDCVVKSQFGQNNCGAVTDIWNSEDEATAALNTGKQYADYVIQYNRESVKLQKVLYELYAKLGQGSVSESRKDYVTSDVGNDDVSVQIAGISFTDVLGVNKQEKIKQFFAQCFSQRKAFQAFAAIKVAINNGYIKEPSFSDIQASFPNFVGTEQNYSGFVGSTGKYTMDIKAKHQKLLDAYEAEISSLLEEASK